ncbi:hypothetical protein PO124_30640 [Bacillus licheniformis]|nr:hypothetical protein [Bacillus licheniformis]
MGQTDYTLTFSSPKELQQLLDKGMVEGFSSQLERLEDYLKAIR